MSGKKKSHDKSDANLDARDESTVAGGHSESGGAGVAESLDVDIRTAGSVVVVHVIPRAARTDKSSPIYGMPILDVDKARTVMVIKRSLNPGFAGIDNALYYLDKTLMLFGDAKGFTTQLVKNLATDNGGGFH